MTPAIFGSKYRIVREIARSNDIVYEAEDVTTRRRVAIKELNIPPNLQGSARRERIERFQREARATGKLSHPNIITVFDFGADSDRYFIAMEYLEGGTLRDAMQQRGAYSVSESVQIMSQVLEALSHAHSRKVIHRDVKPDNIYLLGGTHVKLTDFGIARLTEEASLTGDGQVFGTPSYMSPEQIVGKAIDHRTDIFSCGVVLYELLAGRKPFTGDSVVTITYNIMHNQPPPLHGVSFPLEQVVFKAMSKDPGQRYASAEDMKRAMREAEFAAPAQMGYGQGSTYGGMGLSPSPAPSSFTAPPSYPQSSAPFGAGAFGGSGSSIPGVFGGGGAYNPPPPVSAPSPYPTSGSVFGPPPANNPPPQSSTVHGPFATWGGQGQNTPSNAVGAPVIPQYVRRQRQPLSDASKTFLWTLAIALILGGAVGGGAILFYRAFEQQKVRGAVANVDKLVNEGNKLYNAEKLDEAAEKYAAAIAANPASVPGRRARINLATTWNRLGLRAFERREFRTAAEYFGKVTDLYPSANYIATKADENELSNARYNLGKAFERLNDSDREWARGRDAGRVGDFDPAAPGSNDALQQKLNEAARELQQGNQFYQQGDVSAAREHWTKAASLAPGTQVGMDAQRLLDQTTPPAQF